MDVIAFIEADVGRERKRGALARLAPAGLAFLAAVFGVLLRDGLEGVFEPRVFAPNALSAALLAAVALAAFGRGAPLRPVSRMALAGLLLGALLAVERVFFPPGSRTSYASDSVFWTEGLRCFLKGGVTTALVGAGLAALAIATASWPTRARRVWLAALAGACGLVMLGFHCDSSSVGHVLVGHLGPAVALGAAVFGAQETAVRLSLRRWFPQLAAKLARFGRLSA